jgi:hypothetical protein
MKGYFKFVLLVAILSLSTTCMASEFDIFKQNEKVQPFMQSAYGYAFFPSIGQGGIVAGVSYGKGEVYAMGKHTGTATLVKTTFGLQAGGGSYSELIFFQDKRAYEEFIAGQMDYSFTASAVGVGAAAGASTGSKGDVATTSSGRKEGNQVVKGYQKGVRVFVHITGGLQAGVTVGRQKVKFTPNE